jgi:hypothetical protein
MAFSTRQHHKTAASRLEKSSEPALMKSLEASDLVGMMCSNNGGNHTAYRRDERADESSSMTSGKTADIVIDGAALTACSLKRRGSTPSSFIQRGIGRALAARFVNDFTARAPLTPSRKHAERRMRESAACKS